MLLEVTNSMTTPSENGGDCVGNGAHESYELSCDNCDFYLCCYEVRGFEKSTIDECSRCAQLQCIMRRS